MTQLKLSDVGKTYGGAVEVLKDINLDIDTGELIWQIPNEEALELAIKLHEKMAEMDGLLMSTEV